MGLALSEAQKVLGKTKTNPAVGCILVKNGCVISAASTSLNGRPHAEYNAIEYCKDDIKNSEMYVTLEPCSHYGKTPPCVNKIIKSKIKKVYFSIKDPDKRVFNKSTKLLLKRGILVNYGIGFNEVKDFYKSYIKYKNNELPFVTAKLAVSKDLFANNKKDRWITNKYSRGRVHLMRGNHDCIITSAKTIISDDPRLNCRINGLEKNSPVKIILDKKLATPVNSKIIRESKKRNVIIFYNKVNKEKIKLFKHSNIKLIKMPIDSYSNFNLEDVLIKIKSIGFSRIFLEAGPKLTKCFFDKKLIDDFYLFVSKKKIKKNGTLSIKKSIKPYLKNKKNCTQKVNLLGDKLISYKIK